MHVRSIRWPWNWPEYSPVAICLAERLHSDHFYGENFEFLVVVPCFVDSFMLFWLVWHECQITPRATRGTQVHGSKWASASGLLEGAAGCISRRVLVEKHSGLLAQKVQGWVRRNHQGPTTPWTTQNSAHTCKPWKSETSDRVGQETDCVRNCRSSQLGENLCF